MSFLFYRSVYPRDLHSFPTRRSSDLEDSQSWSSCVACAGGKSNNASIATSGFHEVAMLALLLFPRSEEHTSELQSHSDLVCRLLLEKKKKGRQGPLSASDGHQPRPAH